MHTFLLVTGYVIWGKWLGCLLSICGLISKMRPIISSSWHRSNDSVQSYYFWVWHTQQLSNKPRRDYEKTSHIVLWPPKHEFQVEVHIIHVTFWVSSQRNESFSHYSKNPLPWLQIGTSGKLSSQVTCSLELSSRGRGRGDRAAWEGFSTWPWTPRPRALRKGAQVLGDRGAPERK